MINNKYMAQLRSEIRFLESEEIKWLIHEADIDCCHENYKPIKVRIEKLKIKLKRARFK